MQEDRNYLTNEGCLIPYLMSSVVGAPTAGALTAHKVISAGCSTGVGVGSGIGVAAALCGLFCFGIRAISLREHARGRRARTVLATEVVSPRTYGTYPQPN